MDILSYKLGKNSSGGGGGDLDWSAIGFEGTPKNIVDGYSYAKTIQNNFTPNESLQQKFRGDYQLMILPLIDTSTTTMMYAMCQNCYSLISIATIDTSNVTSLGNAFDHCYSLQEFPQLDTKNCTYFGQTFYNCSALKDVPILDTSNATNMQYMFRFCESLTENSLNNILKMCINATKMSSSDKKLSYIGLTQAQATRCESLSNYQAFLNAGWTTGY